MTRLDEPTRRPIRDRNASPKQQNIQIEFERRLDRIDRLIARLRELRDQNFRSNPDRLIWGHVYDVDGVIEELRAAVDTAERISHAKIVT